MDSIKVEKARVHNLKNITVEIPKNKLVVITGPSGSGKSSLAFDTIYAEGQRRYIESLSSYARQFLGQMEPPDVDRIVGLSPAVAIDQKGATKNPRSTVGTITEIYDYMRVFFARLGRPFCPESHEALEGQSAEKMVEEILSWPDKTKLHLLSPIITDKKGEYKDEFTKYLGMGFSRVRVDGEILSLSEEINLHKNKRHTIEVVIDRIVLKKGIRARLTDSVEQALKFARGHLLVLKGEEHEEFYFSEHLYAPKTKKSYPPLEPRLFSFNSPLGACSTCNGLGVSKIFSKEKMITDESLSLEEGAIAPIAKKNSFLGHMVKSVAKAEKVDLKTPYKNLSAGFKKILFEGGKKVYSYKFVSDNSSWQFKKEFVGLMAYLDNKYHETGSDKKRQELENYMLIEVCPSCKGGKLKAYPLAVKVGDKNIDQISDLSLENAYDYFKNLKFSGSEKIIADKLLREIEVRLMFLIEVGLKYLTLKRTGVSLSGGEAQRIRLATQIGSALSGVIYVLDEPSIGLHQRDNLKLIGTLKSLRDLGNTVIVVEHDEETMMQSDYIIDIGPGAGLHGGQIVSEGVPEKVIADKKSITGRFLSGEESIAVPKERRTLDKFIKIRGAKKNNLKDIDVEIPLGGLVGIVGVSGSGKSTLVHQILTPGLLHRLRKNYSGKKYFQSITGLDTLQSVIELDQSPIGRTPKSNPATYSGAFDEIRKIYANTNESKIRGYKAGRFSFNVKGGRCENCEGNGSIKVEMNFLPDVFVTCDDCFGKRYNRETLNVLYKGASIADVLDMSVEEAVEFFKNYRKLHKIVDTLNRVGLGYMKLGQSSTTLSGGEAQRLKLAKELAKSTRGHCLYILDEPTTGLHFQDIRLLLKAINDLVDQGNSVVIIEHNMDVIKSSDYLIELGPDGGEYGGEIVKCGTPEELAKFKNSITGKYLKEVL